MIYNIKTLQDIYNLPTHKQVETCLKELSKIILQAKAANDLFVSSMRSEGVEVPEFCFKFPEEIKWNDDGKFELGFDFVDKDLNKLLSVKIFKQ